MRRSAMIVILIPLLLSGCATSKKFKKKERANVEYFAEATIASVNRVNLSISRDDAIYTRRYFIESEAEELEVERLLNELKHYQAAIISYSLALVEIAEIGSDEKERVALYAHRIDELDDWVEKNLELETPRYSNVVVAVRGQQTYVDALRESQPIIDAFGRYAEALLEELDAATHQLVNKIDRKIDEEHEYLLVYHEELLLEKEVVLEAIKWTYQIYRGDKGALDKLRSTNAIRRRSLLPETEELSEEQLQEIASHLQVRLKAISEVESQIQIDWDEYRNSHRELDSKHEELDKSRKEVRLMFLVWVQAHRKMASGTVDPADWFDISGVPETLLHTGLRVVW